MLRLKLMFSRLFFPLALLLLCQGVFVSAETTPFNQCVQVVNQSNGENYTNASCDFTDYTGIHSYVSMNHSGSGGLYCIQITDSFNIGTHDYYVNCTIPGTGDVGSTGATFEITGQTLGFGLPLDEAPKGTNFTTDLGMFIRRYFWQTGAIILIIIASASFLGVRAQKRRKTK